MMKSIVSLMLSAVLSLAAAGEIKPYDQSTFDALAREGKPVLLAFQADWCPSCRAQKPIESDLMKQAAYRDVTLLTVDFDSQKAVLKRFKVVTQSTLVAFKGGREVGRSVGDTSRDGIEGLVKKTLH